MPDPGARAKGDMGTELCIDKAYGNRQVKTGEFLTKCTGQCEVSVVLLRGGTLHTKLGKRQMKGWKIMANNASSKGKAEEKESKLEEGQKEKMSVTFKLFLRRMPCSLCNSRKMTYQLVTLYGYNVIG